MISWNKTKKPHKKRNVIYTIIAIAIIVLTSSFVKFIFLKPSPTLTDVGKINQNVFNCDSIKTGIYEDGILLLISDSDKISGVIKEGLLNDEPDAFGFSSPVCTIYFCGTCQNRKVEGSNASSIFPIKIFTNELDTFNEGTIEVKNNWVKVKSSKVLFPCQRVIDLAGGEQFFYSKAAKKIHVGVIKKSKAILYSKPDDNAMGLTKINKGSFFYLLKETAGWCFIEFGKGSKFWIKKTDVLIP